MYLRQVLSDLPPPEDRPMISSEVVAPTEQAFVLGPIGLGYDRNNDRLLVQLEEMVEADLIAESPEDEKGVEAGGLAATPETPERGHIRFYVTRSQADAFCDHADVIIAAGRPSCVWCGNPIDPEGHPCPRMN